MIPVLCYVHKLTNDTCSCYAFHDPHSTLVPHLLIKLTTSDKFRENVDPLLSPDFREEWKQTNTTILVKMDMNAIYK